MNIIISFMELWGMYMSEIKKTHTRRNFQSNINNLQMLMTDMKGLCWEQYSPT
jgi:hypothetical protein